MTILSELLGGVPPTVDPRPIMFGLYADRPAASTLPIGTVYLSLDTAAAAEVAALEQRLAALVALARTESSVDGAGTLKFRLWCRPAST